MTLARRDFFLNKAPQQIPPAVDDKKKVITIEDKLNKLFAIRSKPLSLLTPEECGELDALRKTMRENYGSEGVYEKLFDEIVKRSDNLSVLPHTVGAFLSGCLAPTNKIDEEIEGVNRGCSLLCYDSIPPPKWGFCSQNVILCVTNNSEFAKTVRNYGSKTFLRGPLIPENADDKFAFEFITLTNVPSSSKAILFVDFLSYDEFPGFTRREKGYLIHRMRINDVKLVAYSDSVTVLHKDLLGGKVFRVHELKTRSPPPQRVDGEEVPLTITKSSSRPLDDEQPLGWFQASVLFGALGFLVLLIVLGFSLLRRRK